MAVIITVIMIIMLQVKKINRNFPVNQQVGGQLFQYQNEKQNVNVFICCSVGFVCVK